jgi:integrase
MATSQFTNPLSTPASISIPAEIPVLRKRHLAELLSQPYKPGRIERKIASAPASSTDTETVSKEPNVSSHPPVTPHPTSTQISTTGAARPREATSDQDGPAQTNQPAVLEAVRLVPTMANIVPPTAVSSRAPRQRKAFEPKELARMEFRCAAKLYLEANEHRWRERVIYGYRLHIKNLAVHLGGLKVDQIHIGHVLGYQKARSQNEDGQWRRPAGASIINHEISFLQALLKSAQCWHVIADLYKPLELPAWEAPKTMTEIEKRRFYMVAASKPEFQLALWVATITNQTSCAGTELRHLRLKDIRFDLSPPTMIVNGATAKNNYRGREVSLNEIAVEAFHKCLERAKNLGSVKPEHHLFPLQDKTSRKWDPSQPASPSWLRRSWGLLRIAAGLPRLTPHCLRHQCLTELGERGVARETIRQIAGHSTDKMLDHYCRIRQEKQAQAVAILAQDAFGATSGARVRMASPTNSTNAKPYTCPHCGASCAIGMAFCPNGDILDEAKARVARPWLFRGAGEAI